MKIAGVLDDDRQPKISLVVRGRAKSIRTAFVIDTGFSGDICLPVALAIELGLQLFARAYVEFADGAVKNELTFTGWIDWYGNQRDVEVMLTESEDALLGSGLLHDQQLTINYVTRSVTVEPVNQATS